MKVLLALLLVLSTLSCKSDAEDLYVDYSIRCDRAQQDTSSLRSLLTDFTAGRSGVYVFEEGEDALVTRGWLCHKAQQTIDIQYFIFSVDNVGIIATDYIIRAANTGVQVRLIIDDLMLDVNPDHILALDAHDNVAVKIYNPNVNTGKNLLQLAANVITDFKGINQRMHHKTFIVDGCAAITGGRNIADEYFDFDHEYNFRDRDVLLVGQTADEIQAAFETYWQSDLSVDISSLLRFTKEDYDIAKLYQWVNNYACDEDNYWPAIREQVEQHETVFVDRICREMLRTVDLVEFVSDDPGKPRTNGTAASKNHTTDRLVELVQRARTSIYIQSPYLVATSESQDLFKEAVDRGVEVHILTNSLLSTDNLEAFNGYQRNRKDLLKTGIHLYEYRPDAAIRKRLITSDLQSNLGYVPIFGLHAKTMVVDDSISVIGTFNLDPRSAYLNTECLTIIHSPLITRDILELMKQELLPDNAWQTTPDFNPDYLAPRTKRIKAWLRRVVPESIL